MISIGHKINIEEAELEFSFSRSSGPGGQNVNKVNSKATLRWHVSSSPGVEDSVKKRFFAQFGNIINQEGYAVVISDKYRDQPRNIEDCKDKLRTMLEAVVNPPKKRVPTKPSKAKQKARIEKKRQQSEKKQRRQKINY